MPRAAGAQTRSPLEAAMTALCNMSIRELIYALSQVEDAIRLARLPEPSTPTAEPSADSASAWDDIGQLAAYEQRIVAELRRRRRLGGRLGLEAVERAAG